MYLISPLTHRLHLGFLYGRPLMQYKGPLPGVPQWIIDVVAYIEMRMNSDDLDLDVCRFE